MMLETINKTNKKGNDPRIDSQLKDRRIGFFGEMFQVAQLNKT